MTNIQYDGMFDLATADNSKTVFWKNRQWSWSEFIKKVSETHRTAETYGSYLSSKKSRQDEIKNIGGYVGGFLSGGRRKNGSVVHRQLITLDVDFANADLWKDFMILYDCAAVLYSTHKHSAKTPRYRLIIPLDREVMTDEYTAISRRLAGQLGIELFDHTTFQPTRLMYWPSTSKDGDYVFKYQDGPWLSADEILSSYHDWTDSSEWPVSAREGSVIGQAIKKQGDPLEKIGVIGAFCRTYTIHEAIDLFLGDVYEHCDVEGRYTYKEGSTSAGLVTYDDKFAYSHHGTDPISGKLCNAFDLVRIHKFGLKDEDTDAKGNRLPSFTAMQEFARKDSNVKKQIAAEKIQEVKTDFTEDTEISEDVEADADWMSELEADVKGNYLATRSNFQQILLNDHRLKNKFAIDVFAQRKIITGSLPWRKYSHATRWLIDEDEADLRLYMESKPYAISNNVNLADAFDSVLIKNEVHPLKDYLQSVSWDGASRIDTFFIDYMGTEDSAYTRAVSRKALTAAVARIFKPGIKFDHVLTLVGREGIQKTTIFETLAKKQWFTSNFNFKMIERGKEAAEQLQGFWLVEIGELSGLRKAEIEPVKNFLTLCADVYRVPHAKYTSQFPRQNIFFASTNKWDFLQSNNGNRRFWPVPTMVRPPLKDVNDLDEYEVDQVWAEAKNAFLKGEKLYLPQDLEEIAKELQSEHTEQDDRAGVVEAFLNTLLPENWEELDIYQRREFLRGDELSAEGTVERSRVCVAEIWCEALGGQVKEMNSANTKSIHAIMQSMKGWKPAHIRTKVYGLQRGYVKNDGLNIMNRIKLNRDNAVNAN